MNLLIVSVPDFGHVRAVAAIARVLRNRGHQVYWISSHAIVDYASRAGAVCLEVLPDQLNRDPVDSHLLSSRSMYSWPLEQRFVSLAESALEPTIAAVKGLNLDLVLTDEFALWGPMVADFLGKPWATYCPGLFFSSRERQLTILAMRKQDPLLCGKPAHETSEPWQIGRRLNAQRRKLGLDAVPIFGYVSRSLVLCFTSRAFEYGGAGLPAQARCVGPIFGSSCDLDPRPDGFHELPSGNDPLVYVALGDDFGDREELFHLIKEGLKSSRMHVLFGGASNGNPPVSQAHVLKRASLTVCHGGLNTVQESLCYGVPVIAIPLGADQSAVAGRLEDLQLGLQLSAESFAPSGIQGAVRSALSDDGLTERVRQFQMEAKLSNSTTRAACLLENLAANGSIEASEPTQILELLPERPRFAERFRLTEACDGSMAVRSCSEEYKFGEEPARKAIRWLWESLDGEKRVADVLDTWMGSADLLSLIANLTERGMLEDNVGLERLSPEVRRRYAEQIIVFSHAHAGTPAPHASLRGSELQERLLGASVLVIGTGVLGSNVVRALCQIGIGSIGILGDGIVEQRLIERGAWYREHQAGEGCAHALIEQARSLRPDIEATFSQVRVQNEDAGSLPFDGVHLVVLAEDGFEPGRYAWVDQACHRSRVPWTSIRRNGWEVEIGPTIVPYQTGCFHCFEQRRAGAAGLSLQAGSREGRCFNLAIGPEWLALEALKLLTGFGECLTLGSAAILEPLSMRIGVHRVLRLPNCPRCSRELNSPPESPWLSK